LLPQTLKPGYGPGGNWPIPCSTAGPNAHDQTGSRVTAACVKWCRLDHSLPTHERLVVSF